MSVQNIIVVGVLKALSYKQATTIAVSKLFDWAPYLSAGGHASAIEILLGSQPRLSRS